MFSEGEAWHPSTLEAKTGDFEFENSLSYRLYKQGKKCFALILKNKKGHIHLEHSNSGTPWLVCLRETWCVHMRSQRTSHVHLHSYCD